MLRCDAMPRHGRIVLAGLSHHVYQRGHNRGGVFSSDNDYQRFLRLAQEAAAAYAVQFHGFSLMTNHYHFVVTPETKKSLSCAMRDLLGEYSSYFNRTYARSGTLWNGRFQAKPIEDERYWLTCLRYVEANPVEAGIVAAPRDYPWSSYRVHAEGAPADWLCLHELYLRLGKTPTERQIAYRALWESQRVADWCGT